MDQSTFEAVDPLLDEISELIEEALSSEPLAALRQKLTQVSKLIGDPRSLSLNVTLEVFDRDREQSLPLLNTGLSCFPGDEPFRTWGDSTPQRYIIDGQIQVVPHDHCPKCWGDWDFKLTHKSCPHCDAVLGENCKLLLDTDVCPNCEEGKISMAKPNCDKCGFEIDPHLVSWG